MLFVSCVLGAGIIQARFEELRTRDGTSEPSLKLMSFYSALGKLKPTSQLL